MKKTDKEIQKEIDGFSEKSKRSFDIGYKAGYNQAVNDVEPKWIPVAEAMPPFNKLVLLRGVINWKSKDSVSYFSDEVENDYEILEYGLSGYLLKTNNDYLVVNHPDPDQVCSEYITHWMPLPEPPKP